MAIRYIVLVIAVLIFIWAAVEMSWRLKRRQKKNTAIQGKWVKVDTTPPNAQQAEPFSSLDDNDDSEGNKPGQNLHLRAQQNGHYSTESKKRL